MEFMLQTRRHFAILVATLISSTVLADETALCMAVSEGSTGQTETNLVREKYRPIADEISQAIGRPVKIKVVGFAPLMHTIEHGDCELIYTRTSYIAGWAIRDMQYKLLAANEGNKQVVFIAQPGMKFTSIRDLRGLRIAIPDAHSDLTRVAHAMFRDAGVKQEELQLQQTSLQEAIVFGMDSKLSDVGLLTTNSKAAKDWSQKGGTWALRSRTLPNWSFLGSPHLSTSEADKIQTTLLKLGESSSGKKALHQVNMTNLVHAKPADYMAVLEWVGLPNGI